MKSLDAAGMSGDQRRRGTTFFEVIIVVVLAGVLALIAVPIFRWAFTETDDRLAKLDAYTFERNVRALANTELRAVDEADIATVIEEMGTDVNLAITAAGDGYNVTRQGSTYCVVFGTEVNEPGDVTQGPCV